MLADEPTGSLDPRAAEAVLGALARYHADGGTLVLVTHAERLSLVPDRELELRAGRLVGERAPRP